MDIYKKGVERMEHEFDITEIAKELRNVSIVCGLSLSKYQKALLPYFKKHLITYEEPEKEENLVTSEEAAKLH